MNIAILVYGRLNTCIKNYNNTIDIFDKNHNYDFFLASDNSDEILLNNFIKLYNPKVYLNDKIVYTNSIIKNKYKFQSDDDNHKLTCQYINKKRVFELLEEYIKKTNTKYDIIMSLRLDLNFFEKLKFHNIENNTIYIPKVFRNSTRKYYLGEITDQIAYGTFEVMEKYMKLYDNLLYLQENYNCPAHPETLTFANLIFHKIYIVKIDLDYELDVLRHYIFYN